MNLAKEIVLEPQHYFFMVRESLQSFVLVPQLCVALFNLGTVSVGEIFGAGVSKFLVREIAWGRSANKGFPPSQMFAG